MKKILVAVDLQNDFIDGALGTKEAAAMLPKAIEKIRGFEGDVIFTMDTHGEDYLETAEGKKLPVVHCVKGTDGWRLNKDIEALAREKGSAIIEKPTFGSKELPAFVEILRKGDELDIELIGICTDICVISNAMLLKAHFPEAKITVDSSCCAGVTPESHDNALSAMTMCQIDVI